MNKINITKNQFSDLINLFNDVFLPLKNFVTKEDFLKIINKKKFKNHFFPLPIYFGVTKDIYLKSKKKNDFNLYYKGKYLLNIYNVKFYNLDKKKICKKIYGVNYLKHPYSKKFISENYRFISFDFKKVNQTNLKHKFFFPPSSLKKKIKINKISTLASFHTRNVPHKAHQWIHSFLFKKFGALLIQPLIGQYKAGEYSDKLIVKTNQLASKEFNSEKVFSIPFFSYPRYAGYREAALHAIVRKNYGCSHFWVGRDHAGIKNFFGYKQSQKFCYKHQEKLDIKIIPGNEPVYCLNCKTIKNTKCLRRKCSKKHKIKISGSMIRELLIKNKVIPGYLMDSKISKLISKKSLIN
jgi:sulfate adenylyltransferase